MSLHDKSRCLSPRFDGAILSWEWKEAVWERYATTTHALRAAIQRSQVSLATQSREVGINPNMVAKWRNRAMFEDMKTGPKTPHSTSLSEAE